MLLQLAIIAALFLGVTLSAVAADKVDKETAMDGAEILFGQEPAYQGVERFLIEGFRRRAVESTTWKTSFSLDVSAVEVEMMDEFFSKHFLKPWPANVDLSLLFNVERPSELRGASARKLGRGPSPELETKLAEANIWLHDAFDSLWVDRLKSDRAIGEAHARSLAIIDLVLNPPKISEGESPPSQSEIEKRAVERAVQRMSATFGIDPRESPNERTNLYRLGMVEIEETLRRLGGNAELFRKFHHFDPVNSPSLKVVDWGRKRYDKIQIAFADAIVQERIALESEMKSRRRPRPNEKGVEIEVDREQQVRRIGMALLKRFLQSLDPAKWALYQTVVIQNSNVPVEYQKEPLANPSSWTLKPTGLLGASFRAAETGASLDDLYFPDPYVKEALFKGVNVLPQRGSGGYQYLADESRQKYYLDRIREQGVSSQLRHPGRSKFLSQEFTRYADFLFQETNLGAQIYGTLYRLVIDLEYAVERLQGARSDPPGHNRDKSVEKHTKELLELKAKFLDFRSLAYDNWFKSVFLTSSESKYDYTKDSKRLRFSRLETLRLLGAWAISQDRDYFVERDRIALERNLEPVTKEFIRIQEIYKISDDYSDSLQRNSWREKGERQRAPETKKRPAPASDQPALQEPPSPPLTKKMMIEMGQESAVMSDVEPEGERPRDQRSLLLKVDSWIPGETNLFVSNRLDRLTPMSPLPAETFNPKRDLRVRILEMQPVTDRFLPVFTPFDADLASLALVDEQGREVSRDRYKIRVSEHDGGFVIEFMEGQRPESVRYEAKFRRRESRLPDVTVDPHQMPALIASLESANATVLANDMRARLKTGLRVSEIAGVVAKKSYYAKTIEGGFRTSFQTPADFRDLVTKDGHFVANCLPSNQFVKAVVAPLVRERKVSIESRAVISTDGGRYHRGDSLHASLLVRHESGAFGWIDGTAELGPFESVPRPSSGTLAEIVAAARKLSFGGMAIGLPSFAGSRVFSRLMSMIGVRTTEVPVAIEAKPGEAKPATAETKPVAAMAQPQAQPVAGAPQAAGARGAVAPAEVIVDPIKRAWERKLAPSEASMLRLAFGELSLAHLRFLTEAKKAGLQNVGDSSHPGWIAGRLSGPLLSFARGEKSFDELAAQYERSFGVKLDRARQTPLSYLSQLAGIADRSAAIVFKERERLKGRPNVSEADKNLLLVAEAMLGEVMKVVTSSNMESWHHSRGLLEAPPLSAAAVRAAACRAAL